MTHQASKTLAMLRIGARMRLQQRERNQASIEGLKRTNAKAIAQGDRVTAAKAQILLEDATQYAVDNKFALIEIGRLFVHSAAECEKLPRGDWLRALNVNESEWFTPEMLEQGERLHEVVAGLRLENSATPDTGDISRPLACCFQMAFYNAMKTDQVLAKAAHDYCNAICDDQFGEWVEPTVLPRLGVSA
jgi:hypothetical protein